VNLATRLEPGVYWIKPHPSERAGPIRADEKNGRIHTTEPIGFEDPKALWRVGEIVGNGQSITNVAFEQSIGVYKGMKIPETVWICSLLVGVPLLKLIPMFSYSLITWSLLKSNLVTYL
jgi:hypothetical protein